MHVSEVDSPGRWMIATIAGIVIVVLLLLLFRIPPPVSSLPGTGSLPAPAVQVARPDESDRLLKAESELRDLRPLFLPTERNAALPEPRLEPGRTFLEAETLQPRLSAAGAKVTDDLPALATVDGKPVETATPADALSATETKLSLEAFGRRPLEVAQFERRGGWVEVTAVKNGTRVLSERLPKEALPANEKPWGPVEFMAVVDPAGLVSPLVVIDGSRVDEVDAHYRTYLERDFRIGQRLPPGFYRVTVAP